MANSTTIISLDELKALKSRAMMAEKSGGLFTVRIGVVGGRMQASHLKTIADLSQKFAGGHVHLTTRQGVEIPHVPYENLQALGQAIGSAGMRPAPAGRCVRSITACPGTYCKFGLIDTQSLAQGLHCRFGDRGGLPHKFKIGIAGCRNCCTKPQENDFGVMGTAKGFVVFVGGKMGKNPRLADQLPFVIAAESQLMLLAEVILHWYAANGNDGERFGSAIDRLGIARLVACLSEAQ
jgi:dissimilatory sulfite reductase (desulfoviridin) alpha/beta subunit